jgi:hypothetical protein
VIVTGLSVKDNRSALVFNSAERPVESVAVIAAVLLGVAANMLWLEHRKLLPNMVGILDEAHIVGLDV